MYMDFNPCATVHEGIALKPCLSLEGIVLQAQLRCLEKTFMQVSHVCRFMISVHPEVEARVLAELQALHLMPSAERPQPRAMEYDDMARLTYTSNAIKALLNLTL